jgi:AraC-like DNA-binding protein
MQSSSTRRICAKISYEALLDAITRSSVTLLLVTSLTGTASSRCLNAARRGIVEVVFSDMDDTGVLLAAHLNALVTPTARAGLLHRLAMSLQGLPPPLRVRTLGLFGAARPEVAVSRFSFGARMSRRTVERWIARVGLTGCGTLLRCVRLSHIWEGLQRGESEHAAIAVDAGYDSWRNFSLRFTRLVGVAPTVAAGRLSTNEFVDILRARLHGDC